MNRTLQKNERGKQPVMRLRSLFLGLCALAVLISIPLVLVWQQSYINQISIRLENKADTLTVLNRELTTLNLARGQLSAPARVERIARGIGLEYPISGQLEVVEVIVSRQRRNNGGNENIARARDGNFRQEANR